MFSISDRVSLSIVLQKKKVYGDLVAARGSSIEGGIFAVSGWC